MLCGYVVVRQDRADGGGGGGCVMFVKQGIPSSVGYRECTRLCGRGSVG